MSGYTIFTLVLSDDDAVPADPVSSWPEPVEDPNSYGNRPGELRHYGIDDQTVGIWVHGYPTSQAFIDAIFDSYEVGSVVETISDDTSETSVGRLYTVGTGGVQDKYSEQAHNRRTGDDSEHYGRGLQAYAEEEWGVRPWTIWDIWDDRGWQPTDER